MYIPITKSYTAGEVPPTLVRCLGVDRAYEPFAVRIQIRTAWRQEDRFHTAVLEQRIKRLGEFRIPIMEQIAFTQQKSLKGQE